MQVAEGVLTYKGLYLGNPAEYGLEGGNDGSATWHAGDCFNSD